MVTEQWIEKLKEMSDFYPDFAWMQHIALFIILGWWIWKAWRERKIESRRFLPGYFAFSFLAVCGAAGQFNLHLVEGIAFLLAVIWVVDAFRGKDDWTPSFSPCRWWVIVPLILGFWFPQYVSKYQTHPWTGALLFSPYSIWVEPTLLVVIPILSLTSPQKDVLSKIARGLTYLAGLFFGCLGVIKLKIYWNIPLIIVSAYGIILFVFLDRTRKVYATEGVSKGKGENG